MAHHGVEYPNNLHMEEFKSSFGQMPDTFEELVKILGPTGKFPNGKLNENDEGELVFGIAIDEGKMVMNFGKPIKWIGFEKKQVEELITYLSEKVKEM